MYCKYCKVGPTPLNHFDTQGKCRIVGRERARKWYAENRDRGRQTRRSYYQKNKATMRAQNDQWKADNLTQFRQYQYAYQKRNAAYYRAKWAERNAKKLNATPNWLTEEQHREIQHKYQMAQDISKLTDKQYHVDHIHPLQGETICGLHVPWNLQIILATENLKKGNKF